MLYRGYAALKTRWQPLWQLFLLPTFLSLWGIVSLWKEAASLYTFTYYGVGILIGFWVAWQIWRSGSYSRETGLFERKGSPSTLILIVLIFTFKYTTSVMIALNIEITHGLLFRLLSGGISGFFCGLFWGGTGWLLTQKFNSRD